MGLFQKCLQLVLQPHPVAPQLVLLARYRPPQTLLGIRHKAQRQFSGHQPLHQAFGIAEILLAPSRFSRTGFQYRSSVPQTGFQYCAVDSMTTSSASCSTSHAANDRSCSGLLLNILRSNWYSLSISTSDTTTASTFLWTSIPASL